MALFIQVHKPTENEKMNEERKKSAENWKEWVKMIYKTVSTLFSIHFF